MTIQQSIFDIPIPTDVITFNTRQHRLCDYLLDKRRTIDNYLDKVDILWDLRTLYFSEKEIGRASCRERV